MPCSLTTYTQARSQAEGLLDTSYWEFAGDHPSPSSVSLQMAIMLCNGTTCEGVTYWVPPSILRLTPATGRNLQTAQGWHTMISHNRQTADPSTPLENLCVIVRCDPPRREVSHTRPIWHSLPELCCTAVAPHSVMQLRRGDELQALTAPGQLKGRTLRPCQKPQGGGCASAECVKPHVCIMKPGNPISPVTDMARSSAISCHASPPG